MPSPMLFSVGQNKPQATQMQGVVNETGRLYCKAQQSHVARAENKEGVVFDRISPECWKHLHADTVLLMSLDTSQYHLK